MEPLQWPESGAESRGIIDGPAGALEVVAAVPEFGARGVIVVCHPHPQHGGTLDNKVTYMIARAVQQSGYAAVRFNYRGVGQSAGDYDNGRGELDDARAVRAWALGESQRGDGGLAGFSFGAWVAMRLAAAEGAASLTTVGLPVGYFEGELPQIEARWLAVFGDADDVIDVAAAIATVKAYRPAPTLAIMDDAGHFLHGRLAELRRHVTEHLGQSSV